MQTILYSSAYIPFHHSLTAI